MKDLLYKILILLSIAITLLTMATSCTHDIVAPAYAVTEEDAAELTANAILAPYGGVLAQVSDAIAIDQGHAWLCGASLDTLASEKSPAGSAPVSFTSALNWHSYLDCTTGNLTNDYSGNCNYDGPHFSNNSSLSGNLLLKVHGSTTYRISFTQKIDGSTGKKTVSANKFQMTITLNSSDMTCDAATKQITSGQISVSIAISSSGNVSGYAGTFKFLSNRKANLILNSGHVYYLNL